MAEDMIVIQNVTKRFRETTALNNVSVNFAKGKIHGLIGRNGSGKTVLLKCICGFMKPTEGEIYIDGKVLGEHTVRDIGIILEEPGFIGAVSGFKNLKMLASIQKKIDDTRIRETMSLVGLDANLKKPVKHYSLGMRHRLAIAQAIMEYPALLLLDELYVVL